MKVTDKNLTFEDRLVKKLDLIVKRLKGTDDAVVMVDGDEGQGKTNMACGLCYYISQKTKRHYGIDRIFFDLDKLIKFASETKEQTIHWDEGALGGLSIQWWKKNQQKFIQLLMIARKKKHFIVICIPKFYRLNEYLNVERTITLIHVYARQNLYKGRFFYFTKGKKEKLYDEWRRKHKKSYIIYKSFGGWFPKYMELIFSEEEIQKYEDKKDEAIMSLSKEDVINKAELKLKKLQYTISQIPKKFKIKQIDIAKTFNVSPRTIQKWADIPLTNPHIQK